LAQRLVGFEHDGEFGKIETADMNQRTGARYGGNSCGMCEGIACLAQSDRPKWRRQAEGHRKRRLNAALYIEWHGRSYSHF
jgi:hypothetical protein